MNIGKDYLPNPSKKEKYTLEFNDDFKNERLDLNKWIPYYLPQWSSKNKSKPNFYFEEGNLILAITKNQEPWCPEFNGEVKCSSIQTGLYSGKLGTDKGQHKFNKQCVVREEQMNEKKYLPQYGYFEIRAKSPDTPSNVVALWMIGYEENPEESAEICIFEVKGTNVKKNSSIIGYGIHKFNDPNLKEEFYEEEFDIDVTKFHIYAVEWTSDKVDFFIDNKLIRTINQSPEYPMQFMLNIYEVPIDEEKTGLDTIYPKKFEIDYVRGYKREGIQ